MTPLKWLSVVLGVLGLLSLVVAVIYFSVPAHSLPSFLGPLNRVQAHRKRRGEAAIALTVVLAVIVGILVYVDRRSSVPKATSSNPTSNNPASNNPASDNPAAS
ncbi:MAG TPA: hypothetical protein VK283_00620 [Acidimicrobiales bacterium]|nr:hypothetical protein [Acidimicrobiales bacterium]